MIAGQRGFTLIEMVVTMVVSAIVLGFMSMFLVSPVQAYLAQERRTDLTDSANSAIRVLKNDIRSALPESVRFANVGGRRTLELLSAPDVARYRAAPSSGNAAQDLALGSSDAQFALLGRFVQLPTGVPICNAYLAIGHSEQGDAYALSNVITPAGTCVTLGVPNPLTREQAVVLDAAVTFPALGSQTRSVFYVEGPVSYVCNPAAGTLTRFWNYGILANQAGHATEAQLNAAGASSSLVARDVTACDFRYTPGTPRYGGLVRLRMTIARGGETLRVFEQIQVENRP